jgi:hypothetical protein
MYHKISYSIFGLIIGAILGSLIGFGELNYQKKSARQTAFPILLVGGAIIGSITGVAIGFKYGTKKHIDEITGIDKITTKYYKQGRFWIGISEWKDSRKQEKEMLTTAKADNNILVTALNNKIILSHEINSGSQVNVEKFHKKSLTAVTEVIRSNFDETAQKDLSSFWKSLGDANINII